MLEDDIQLLGSIRDILELDNFLVLASQDAYAARLAIDSFCPDIVILGFFSKLSFQYKQLANYCYYYYPIVYICGRDYAVAMRQNQWYTDEDKIIIKPFDAEELFAIISLVLEQQGKL